RDNHLADFASENFFGAKAAGTGDNSARGGRAEGIGSTRERQRALLVESNLDAIVSEIAVLRRAAGPKVGPIHAIERGEDPGARGGFVPVSAAARHRTRHFIARDR